jgi:hypothetical protein
VELAQWQEEHHDALLEVQQDMQLSELFVMHSSSDSIRFNSNSKLIFSDTDDYCSCIFLVPNEFIDEFIY